MAKLISWLAKNQDTPKYGGKIRYSLSLVPKYKANTSFLSLIRFKKFIATCHDLVINIEVLIFRYEPMVVKFY